MLRPSRNYAKMVQGNEIERLLGTSSKMPFMAFLIDRITLIGPAIKKFCRKRLTFHQFDSAQHCEVRKPLKHDSNVSNVIWNRNVHVLFFMFLETLYTGQTNFSTFDDALFSYIKPDFIVTIQSQCLTVLVAIK